MEPRNHRSARESRRSLARLPVLLGVFALGLAVAGCDSLLEVEAPGDVDASDLDNPENAHLLASGAIADFDCALNAYIVNVGLLGNELRDASFTAARFPLDSRNINASEGYGVNACNSSPAGIYRPLSTAIWTANNALTKLQEWTDAEVANRTDLIAQSAAYLGYSQVLMGEGFCTAVIEAEGPELQPQQVFESAVTHFTTAVSAAQTAGDNSIRNMALLGRARANLNLGNTTQAAADARDVLANDPGFTRVATASSAGTSRRFNRVGSELFSRLITIDPLFRDLMVQGELDTRTRVIDSGVLAVDNEQNVFLPAKIGVVFEAGLRDSPVPIATWREAHLIIAEAEGGQEAVNRINILRAAADLPAYGGGTAQEIAAQVVEERARELFLEGHHLNDVRRFNLALLPPSGAAYRTGGVYGDARCFPLPDVERDNNPNL
jgi:hypothetical protein